MMPRCSAWAAPREYSAQRQVAQLFDRLPSDDPPGFVFDDVHVVAGRRLGGRREDRLGEPVGFAQARPAAVMPQTEPDC